MNTTDLPAIESPGMHKVLCLLDAVRNSPTGVVIYNQVERLLQDVLKSQKSTEHFYITLINRLLDAYVGHLLEGSPLHIQVRLLQARLQPPLPAGDLEVLREYVDQYAAQVGAFKQLDSSLFQTAIQPLLASFGIVEDEQEKTDAADAYKHSHVEVPAVEAGEPERHRETGLELPRPETGQEYKAEADTTNVPEPDNEWRTTETAQSDDSADQSITVTGAPLPEENSAASDPLRGKVDRQADTRVDTVYRSHLDSKRRDIQKLQTTLAEQVLGTIAQNDEFGVLLEVVLGELRQAGDGRELEDLRWTLVREIEKLTKAHHELAEKLDSTHHYLQLIESDSRQLSDELTRVRLLSLTDELTGLPNRRAFLRRIEDEVARVQRYGFPLSLALMDLDHFKQVNDEYGHAGGDEVLQMYSKNILSIFRHHDLVARYGGEEFAVLLPNTDEEGSMRALTKVRSRALETRWQANGDMIPVPSFSAGVSLYKPGETATAFIERADKALYRAKRLGRNRVEMDATYRSDAQANEELPGATTGNGEHQHSES
ncbi:MAG TPA: GGDEF domain-containing protein [Gammaproteobacteria bacterium]|nr:GGDEF domain-containing protein [Gammaproteobacteria bacterium]